MPQISPLGSKACVRALVGLREPHFWYYAALDRALPEGTGV